MVLEKSLESPLDSKEIQPIHPKGNQSCIFIGRMNADAEISLDTVGSFQRSKSGSREMNQKRIIMVQLRGDGGLKDDGSCCGNNN